MIPYKTPGTGDRGPDTRPEVMELQHGVGHMIRIGAGYPVGYVVEPGRDVQAYLHAKHPNNPLDQVISMIGSDHLQAHLSDRPHITSARRVKTNHWGTFAWPDVSISASIQPKLGEPRHGSPAVGVQPIDIGLNEVL